jgi:hypothetical protein
MRNRILIVFFAFFSGMIASDGQNSYPKDYFRQPVNERIVLAGSFGELRRNHLHSGIDIRTDGVQGKPVYAAADGYVSRIGVSPAGFGKALYITHPNGYVSVYGHLRNFNKAIGAWTRAYQYKNETFTMDVKLQPGDLPVKKGELIAWSGNSGASGGPHLHFEIRDAVSEEAINPLFFGIEVRDLLPPRITRAMVCPADGNARVNQESKTLSLPVTGQGESCRIKTTDTIKVSGNIIFGISTYDLMSDNSMQAGVHSVELYVDTALCFSQYMNRFAFADSRAVNSMLDYPLFIRSGARIQRSYVAPNNNLRTYGRVKNSGIVNFSDNKPHKIAYVVKDDHGNTSRLVFWVRSRTTTTSGLKAQKIITGTLLPCKKENHFEKDGVRFDLPPEALYEDLDFRFSRTPAAHGAFSGVIHLQDKYTPLHTWCTLAIKPEGMPARLYPKAVIALEESPGHFTSKGGSVENGFITTKVRDLGNFTILVDTIPPAIRPLNIANNKNIRSLGSIRMKISDNLSGIKSWRGTLNGKWILMDYDAKYNSLVYAFDDLLKPGDNAFRLVVTDESGNEAVYSATLKR